MRIDVAFAHRDIDLELARLYERMNTPGDALHGLPQLPCAMPGFALRYREIDGAFHVCVEDVARRVLAGSTVFGSAPEVGRPAQRFLRSPHSRYGRAYQRRGLASMVYAWALQAGLCLISGPRQSVAAHRLWLSLGREHELVFVELRAKQLQCCGPRPGSTGFDKLDARMLLLGSGWNLDRLSALANCGRPRLSNPIEPHLAPMARGCHGRRATLVSTS